MNEPAYAPAVSQFAPSFNLVHGCVFRSGWVAWLSGENQEKAAARTVAEINAAGRKVAACAPDRWSIWKRIGMLLLLIVTLGFVGRSPGLVMFSEPM